MSPTKYCAHCKQEKTLSEFYKRKASRDGLQSRCRVCADEFGSSYKAAHPDKERARQVRYHAANRERKCINSTVWYRNNTERAKARQAVNRHDNRERDKKRSLEWRLANPLKFKATSAAYAKRNPHKFAANNARRKAIRLRATPTWADHEIMDDFYQEAVYFQCQIGHIVPLRSKLVCGLHWEGNLQILSKAENISKGNRHS